MSRRPINIAFIRSKAEPEFEQELSISIRRFIKDNDRYKHVTMEYINWDEPGNVDWSQYTHIIITTYIIYIGYEDEFLSWFNNLPEDAVNKLYNSRDLILWNICKTYLKYFEERNIPTIPTVWLNKSSNVDAENIIKELEKKNGGPVDKIVCKNITDADGTTTTKINMNGFKLSSAEVNKIESLLKNSRDGLMVQTFMENVKNEGEWSLIYFNYKHSHCILKKPSGNEFRTQGRYGGTVDVISNEQIPEGVKTAADKIVAAMPKFPRTLYTRVDLIRDTNGNSCLTELELFEPHLYISDDHQLVTVLNLLENGF